LNRVEIVVGKLEGPNRRVAFYGRGLGSYEHGNWKCTYVHTAYITEKGKLLIYTEVEGGQLGRDYKLFNTFKEAGEEKKENGEAMYPPEFLSLAAKELDGTNVEELDV
jgi:hypothetical protein